MSKLKLERFLEILEKCGAESILEIECHIHGNNTKRVILFSDWESVKDIVEIEKHHVINYQKSNSQETKEKIVRIVLE